MLAERVDRPFGIALAGEIDAHQRLGTDEAAKIEKFVGADLAGLDPAPHQIVHRRARGPGADALTPPVISAQQPAPAQHRRRQRARGGDQIGAPRSEEHTSELQSLMRISYAVFCLKKKKTPTKTLL